MGAFYDIVMSSKPNSFQELFNMQWNQSLDCLDLKYANAIQMRIGNQLRPKLTCWGAAIHSNSPEDIDLNLVAKIAASIEMLHKASIIIDDMIDHDDARHGKQTFHLQYGEDRATIFALVLIGKGASALSEIFTGRSFYTKCLQLYTETIKRMATGCLYELDLDRITRFESKRIKEIIDFETISLIKNSLLLGYWSHGDENKVIEKIIIEIGKDCGYIFQVLNDLEPFACMEKNQKYKGGENIDINRNRKNIAVAYIFGAATNREKDKLLAADDVELQKMLFDLYTKYCVHKMLSNEVALLVKSILIQADQMPQNGVMKECINDFKTFINEMVSICFSRLEQR